MKERKKGQRAEHKRLCGSDIGHIMTVLTS